MTNTLVSRLRERAGKYDEYDWHGAIELEAANELERLLEEDRQWDKSSLVQLMKERDEERTKRQQAEHERDCAVEDLKRLKEHAGPYAAGFEASSPEPKDERTCIHGRGMHEACGLCGPEPRAYYAVNRGAKP